MIHSLLGLIIASTSAFHVRVDGEGYLRFVRDARVVYAKEANLEVIGGKLCSQSGYPLIPLVVVSDGVGVIKVDLQGTISAGGRPCGRIVLAIFGSGSAQQNSDGFLVSIDRPALGNPGEGTYGVIRQSGSEAQNMQSSSLKPLPLSPKPIVKAAVERQPMERSEVVISVRPQSAIHGKTFTLGEIAEVQGPSSLVLDIQAICLGDSPPLGTERGIDQTRIVSRLRMAGIKPDGWAINVPSGAKVKREGTHITQEEFVQVAQQAVVDQLGIKSEMNSPIPAPEMVVPPGEIKLVAESATGSGGKASVVIGVYVDSRRFNSRTVALVCAVTTSVVRAGTTVKVLLVSSGATVQTTGKTKSMVSQGQKVEVVTGAGVVLTGTLLPNGAVEVKL